MKKKDIIIISVGFVVIIIALTILFVVLGNELKKNSNIDNSPSDSSYSETVDTDENESGDNTALKASEKPQATDHIHTEVIDKAVPPTCTEEGKSEGKHCSICNKVLVEQKSVPAKEHTEVVDKGIAATCVSNGKTDGKHCSVCNKTIVEQKIIPAKGHTEVIDEAVPETCYDNGQTEGTHCSTCNTVLVAQKTIYAHHTEEIDDEVPATCYDTGLTEGKHCSECGYVIVEQRTISKQSHSYYDDRCTKCGFDKSIEINYTTPFGSPPFKVTGVSGYPRWNATTETYEVELSITAIYMESKTSVTGVYCVLSGAGYYTPSFGSTKTVTYGQTYTFTVKFSNVKPGIYYLGRG